MLVHGSHFPSCLNLFSVIGAVQRFYINHVESKVGLRTKASLVAADV